MLRAILLSYVLLGLLTDCSAFDLLEYVKTRQLEVAKTLGVSKITKSYETETGKGSLTTFYNAQFQEVKNIFVYEHLGENNWKAAETVTEFEWEGDLLIKRTVRELDEPTLNYFFEYNSAGEVTKRVKKQNGKFLESAVYNYDEHGRLTTSVFSGLSGITEIDSTVYLSDSIEYRYVRMAKGKAYLSSITKRNKNGLITLKVMRPYSKDNPEAGGENVFRYKYDEHGNKAEYLWSSGTHGKISHHRYYYSESNICELEESYRATTRDWISKYYKFDEHRNPKNVFVKGDYEVKYTYYKNGLVKAVETKFDKSKDQSQNRQETYTYEFGH